MNKLTDHILNPVYTTGQDGQSFSADSAKLHDYVVDFLQTEVGGDVKSLKNVGDLLEKLREENNVLEEQVNRNSVYMLLYAAKSSKGI